MELNYTHLSCSGLPFMPDWEQACSARWCTDTFRENLGSTKSLKSDIPKINLKSWHEVTLKSRRRLQVDWKRVCLPVTLCIRATYTLWIPVVFIVESVVVLHCFVALYWIVLCWMWTSWCSFLTDLFCVQIILPNTACENGNATKLFQMISDEFQQTTISTVQRRYFNETKGAL